MVHTVAVVGISGVGKTTLIRSLSDRLSFQHLSAGSLIGEEKARLAQMLDHDDLRLADIGDNQRLLIEGFRRQRNPSTLLVILDGHTVIDTLKGLEPIPAWVFAELHVQMFVFLRADPAQILKRRTSDKLRKRPVISVDEVARHQDFALEVTLSHARDLAVPCHVISAEDVAKLSEIFQL